MPKVQSKTTIRTSRVGGTYSRAGGDSKVALSKNKNQCDVCKKFYSRASDLTRHERLHSDDEDVRYPFKCTQCPKRFSNKDALKPHMQSKHSTDAEYRCRICGELHRTKSGLTHHERRHQKSRFVAQRLARRRQRAETISETSPADSLPVSSVGSPSHNSQFSGYALVKRETESFASHLSPSSNYPSRAESFENESGSSGAVNLSPALCENQYNSDLQVDHTAFNPIQPDVFPFDFSQIHNYANEDMLDFSTGHICDEPVVHDPFIDELQYQFDLSLSPEGLVFPSQVQDDFDLEINPYTYSYADQTQTYFSGLQGLFQNMTAPAVLAPQEIDAFWNAWIAQDGELSLTDYFNPPFQFNDVVSELGLSYDMFSEQAFTLDHLAF